jgi:hypothetical protein
MITELSGFAEDFGSYSAFLFRGAKSFQDLRLNSAIVTVIAGRGTRESHGPRS